MNLICDKNTVILQPQEYSMQKENKKWYVSWFNSPYYHILYKKRDHREAAFFMNNLTRYLELKKEAKILDLACGNGRHSKYLFRKGFDVTGLDLSVRNITEAKQYARPRLKFEVHDMTIPYPDQFDAVFNLFTSFGYFEFEIENLETILAIKKALKPGGSAVIDFLNVNLAIENMIPYEVITIDSIDFHIEKKLEDGFIVKNIRFEDKGKDFFFKERVKALTLEDFKIYFEEAGVNLQQVFGDYHLNSFNDKTSERLILIFD